MLHRIAQFDVERANAFVLARPGMEGASIQPSFILGSPLVEV
jgi:hypothetical protein